MPRRTDERRADMVVELVRRGYGELLLLSCDLAGRRRLSTNGGAGYAHLITEFLPLLRARGLDDDLLDQLTRVNPQRMLAG